MRAKLQAVKSAMSKKNKSRYGVLLSVVALVEVVMISLVSTFAWVETISSIEISNTGGKIDTFTYTNAEVGFGTGYEGEPIDLEKYFRASGNVHLSPASSADGTNFFFPRVAQAGSNGRLFRRGSINDKNTNYISFTFRVTAKGTSADFYFDSVPTFKIDGEEVADNKVRVAIGVADDAHTAVDTKVYSYKNVNTEYVVGNTDGSSVTTTKINAFEDYCNSEGNSGNILFSVPKETSKIVTLTLWIQDPEIKSQYAGKSITAQGFKIVTGIKTTKINFVDKTSRFNDVSGANSWHWIGNNNAKVWVTTPLGEAFQMTQSTEDPTLWTVSIANDDIGDKNGNLIFYRTESTPNNYTHLWRARLADAGTAKTPTYTAYGNSKGGTIEGCGTWGTVAEIKLLGDGAENVLTTPASGNTAQQVTLEAGVDVPMTWENHFWRAFIPNDKNSDSKNLYFSFSKDASNYSIYANNRDTTEDASTYRVTSSKTGYWEAPAVVKAVIPAYYDSMGTVSVSGGPVGATTVKVTRGTSVTLSAAVKSDDCAFEGWYSDADCTKRVSEISEFVYIAQEKEKVYTFYAKFQYNVRLAALTDEDPDNDNSGEVQINDEGPVGIRVSAKVQKGDSVKLIAKYDSKVLDFMGWRDKNGNLLYVDKPTVVIDKLEEPINLTAVYLSKEYTLEAYAVTNGVIGDASGGTVRFINNTTSDAHVTVKIKRGGRVCMIAEVSDSDIYEFAGWYCGDEMITDKNEWEIEVIADKNKTFYAKFIHKKFDVKAIAVSDNIVNNAIGGTVKITAEGVATPAGAAAQAQVTYGKPATFTAQAKSGYEFIGWYDSAESGKLVSDKTEYVMEGVAVNKTLYARFIKSTITTTIYFTPRNDFSVYYAYIYNSADGNKHYMSPWPGDKAEYDSETGYYKYSFETPGDEPNGFRVIVNNKAGTQYPSSGGFSGSFGKTYLFSGESMTEYSPVNVTINAVSVNKSGAVLSNGFTGGSITVDGAAYNKETTFKRNKGEYFSANAVANGLYRFEGWYTDAKCTVSAGTYATLSVTLTESKTYYAKFVEQSGVTITFDAANTSWVSNAGARMFVYNRDTYTEYEMTPIGNNKWTAEVPADVVNISFYRCTPQGFGTNDVSDSSGIAGYWNRWITSSRGTCTTYITNGNDSGYWQY